MIEQDHRFIKKKVRASRCFKWFHTAERTLEGIEAVNMIRKGQVNRLAGSDAQGQAIRLCDRGFDRVRWLEKFAEFEQQFVVRLTRDVTVRLADRVCLLKNLDLRPGERRDFGWVRLRSDELVRVRLIGV